MSRVWLFNLDADDELARPVGFSRRETVRRRIDTLVPRLSGVLRPGDAVLSLEGEPRLCPLREVDPGDEARLWCPTPSALRRAEQIGLAVDAPTLEVLQRVNHRAFAAEWNAGVEAAGSIAGFEEFSGSVFADSLEQALAVVAGPAPAGGWLMKRAHGFSGTTHRRLRSELAADDRRWMAKSFGAQGGLHLEPFVEREAEFVMHGFIDREAAEAVRCAGPYVQRCSEQGAWMETRPAADTELCADERRILRQGTEGVGGALLEAGYFGPFGVDAFRWRDQHGALHLRALSDLNARHPMGWSWSQDLLDPL